MKQKEIHFGETRFVLQQLPATEALTVAIHLSKIIAGASDGVGSTFADDLMGIPINPAKIVSGLIDRMDAKETPLLIKKMVIDSVVRPDNFGDDDFNTAFAGNLDHLIDFMIAIIELNNFIEVLKKRVQAPLKALFSANQKGSTH